MEVGAQDIQGLPLLAQPAPRQSCVSMAGKPMPSSHESPCQWNQAPVTLIYQWKNKGGGRVRKYAKFAVFYAKIDSKICEAEVTVTPLINKICKPWGGGGGWGKRMILRLSKESGRHENVVLST